MSSKVKVDLSTIDVGVYREFKNHQNKLYEYENIKSDIVRDIEKLQVELAGIEAQIKELKETKFVVEVESHESS